MHADQDDSFRKIMLLLWPKDNLVQPYPPNPPPPPFDASASAALAAEVAL
jgi:hypothetical protein